MLSLNNNSKSEQTRIVRSGHRGVWSVVAILITMSFVGASTWWLNAELQAQGSSLAKLLGMQKRVDSLSERMIGAETALSTFPAEVTRVTGRVDALDKRISAVQKAAAAKPAIAATASTPASPAVAELGTNVAQLNEQMAKLQARHEDDATVLESLRQDLANTREQTAVGFAVLKSVIPNDATADVAGLQNGIASLANKMDRDRHDFEVHEDRVVELVPGVLLTIRDTNVGRQEISGWIYLENDRRVVWLKNHGLLQPITVYGVYGKQSHDIVITRVRKDDAIGFVLSPKTDAQLAAGN